MKNMKVSMKLIVGFLIVVALSMIIGIVGLYGILTMDAVSADMYTAKAKPLGDLATAMEYFQRIRVQVRNAILYEGDTNQLKTVEADLDNRYVQFETSMASYKPTLATKEGEALFAEIMEEYEKRFKPGIESVMHGALADQSQSELIPQLTGTTASATIIADNLAELTNIRMRVMSEANDASTAQGQLLLVIIIVVIIVSAVISILLALYISRLISKPAVFMKDVLMRIGTKGDLDFTEAEYRQTEAYAQIKDEIGESVKMLLATVRRLVSVGEELGVVANGDLTVELPLLSDRDTMGHSLKKMVDNLNNMFSEINASTAQVSTGSKQIADGAQALAQGSTEQAAAVEQLSSSISEIALKTKDNADMAGKAASLANTIKHNAEKGSSQMSQMMDAVKDINEASQSINKVIKVIDDIAFQTNILALNAAVEAARAGQHGKGFAVVAEEVRSLAAKSAEAAKDTGALIANSMEKAELGARIADETAASLVEIVSGINESSQLVGLIAQSSDEQSLGIDQINKGIDQVAQVIQQNSATAEESAAASEEMSGQANMLEDLISQFSLKGGNNTRRFAPPANQGASKRLDMPAKPSGNSDGFGKY